MTEHEDRGTQRVIEGNTELQRSEPTHSDVVQHRDYAERHADRRRGSQRLFWVSGNFREGPRILSQVFSDYICKCIPCKDSFPEEEE